MEQRLTYYQPFKYFADDHFVEWGSMPEELASFMVFRTREDCEYWLEDNGYEPSEWAIIQYHDDDIEEPTFLDRYGNYVDGMGSVSCYNTEKDLDEGYDLLQIRIREAMDRTGETLFKIDPVTLYEDDATLGGENLDYYYRPTIVAIDKTAAYGEGGEVYFLEKITDYDDYMMLADAVDFATNIK